MAETLRKSDRSRTHFPHAACMLIPVAMQTILLAAAAGGSSEAQLESAIHREVVLGDLTGAIEQFKAIAGSAQSKAIAARALFHAAQCLEKSGRRAEAYDAYTRVVKEHADQ